MISKMGKHAAAAMTVTVQIIEGEAICR